MVTRPALAQSVAPQAGNGPAAAESNVAHSPAPFLLALQSAGGLQSPSAPTVSGTGSRDVASPEDTACGTGASAPLPPQFVIEALSTVRALSTARTAGADTAHVEHPAPLDAQGAAEDVATTTPDLLLALPAAPDADPQAETGSGSDTQEPVVAGMPVTQPLVVQGAATAVPMPADIADPLATTTEACANPQESLLPPEIASARVRGTTGDATPRGAAHGGTTSDHGPSSIIPGAGAPSGESSLLSLQTFTAAAGNPTGADTASAVQGTDASGSVHAAAAHAIGTESTAAAPERALPRELRHTPGTPAWADELGTQLRWMVREGLETASLRLHPEELGPLEIRVTVQDGEARVWFAAAHADTRTAIENALPRLREMLASQGLVLSDAGVFREPPRDPARGNAPTPARAALDEVHETNVTAVATSRRGIVDIYA